MIKNLHDYGTKKKVVLNAARTGCGSSLTVAFEDPIPSPAKKKKMLKRLIIVDENIVDKIPT